MPFGPSAKIEFAKKLDKASDALENVLIDIESLEDRELESQSIADTYEIFDKAVKAIEDAKKWSSKMVPYSMQAVATDKTRYELGNGLVLSMTTESPTDHPWRLNKEGSDQLLLSAMVRKLPNSDVPALQDILAYPEARGKGYGRLVLSKLIEHYGQLRSDDKGRTSDSASKMWVHLGAKGLRNDSKGFGGSWYAMEWENGKAMNMELLEASAALYTRDDFEGFNDPWAVMSPEDRKEANRLFKLAMKAIQVPQNK